MGNPQDVVALPHKRFNPDDLDSMAIAIHQNFNELEHQLAVLQHTLKRLSGGALTNLTRHLFLTESVSAPRFFEGTNNSNTIRLPINTDLNAIIVTGVYDCEGFLNRPVGIANWAYLSHIVHGGNPLWATQTLYGFHDNREVYFRRAWDNSGVRAWTAWQRLWHEGTLAPQRGTAVLGAGATTDVTITSVVVARSFVALSGDYPERLVSATITTPTNVRITNADTVSRTINWHVITFL